ncbi:hypothetical protein B0H19DRAFT_1083200 [Mycena capillaripes]|nr:hypothetical protein B0H19DRAFT_1083200 [Mycena capillaripes]
MAHRSRSFVPLFLLQPRPLHYLLHPVILCVLLQIPLSIINERYYARAMQGLRRLMYCNIPEYDYLNGKLAGAHTFTYIQPHLDGNGWKMWTNVSQLKFSENAKDFQHLVEVLDKWQWEIFLMSKD